MSRDYANCTICERDFVIDSYDDDPCDVCGRCVNRISRIADQRIHAERLRLSSTILTIAAQFGGPTQAALEAVAAALTKANPQ